MEIPRCVGTVEETIAIVRKDREEWLAQQRLSSHDHDPRE
jgi:hypothetical protein